MDTLWTSEYEKNVVRKGKHLPYEQRLTILNMPTIAFRHLRGTMINTYKYATHKYKCQLLNFNTTSVTRSNGYKLVKNRFNTVKYQNFYTNSTINAWNWLPAEVVSAETVNIFLNRLDNNWKNYPAKFNATANPSLRSKYIRLSIIMLLTNHARTTTINQQIKYAAIPSYRSTDLNDKED